MSRLNFIRHNQQTLRADQYACVRDALNSDQTATEADIGNITILPSSFSGGPRHMQQLFQDAMACMRVHGKPDLFVTFTANPNWPEILAELLPTQVPNDRPDLISRVFQIKLKCLLNDLIKEQIFGKVVAHIYVIEWQKRGLPHAHILICLEESDKAINANQVDEFIKAEIPDPKKYPQAYLTISKSMVHGPCGISFPNAPCMVNGKCSKDFPKAFCPETILANDRYPIYQRRNDGQYIEKSGVKLSNQWIVPHNLYLSVKYDAHINVEICNTIGAVKYLFKYVYKGSDKVTFSLQKTNNDPPHQMNKEKSNDRQANNQTITKNDERDEIKKFTNGRYVSASEAFGRTMMFDINGQDPHTIKLPVHLENQQNMIYKVGSNLKEQLNKNCRTQLSEFF